MARIDRESFVRSKRLWVWEYKQKHPCVECGERHPAKLSFHHRCIEDKAYSIGQILHSNSSFKTLENEVGKCDVLCHNCHNHLHWLDGTNALTGRMVNKKEEA